MIDIKMSFPDLAKKLKEHEQQILQVLAAVMQTNRSMMFDRDGADNGKAQWKPLAFRKGRPLQNTGTLRNSMAPNNDGITPGKGRDSIVQMRGTSVSIGTKLQYARLMNDGTTKLPGGVLKPVNAQALKIPLPRGKKASDLAKKLLGGATRLKDENGKEQNYIFRKSVRIPARPMDIVTKADEAEFAEALQGYITEVLNGK